MGSVEGGTWLIATTLTTGVLFYLGMRKRRLASVAEDTPTTSGAQPVEGDTIEIQGRVVAGEKTFETLVPGRQAVWYHLNVEEADGVGHDATTRTIFDVIHTADFLVDDRSGRMVRVVPPSVRGALTTKESGKIGTREQLLARLRKAGVKGFDTKKLVWKENALHVDDAVYVLGRGELVEGRPEADGYRSMVATQQLVMRGTHEAPLVVAAMTEARYVEQLKSKGQSYFVWAMVIAIVGSIVSLLASLATS